jgi:hypothetical protein
MPQPKDLARFQPPVRGGAAIRTDTLELPEEVQEKEKNMFGGSDIYVQAAIYELERARKQQARRHFRGNPDAEIPRTGVGIVHEVFRRITGS